MIHAEVSIHPAGATSMSFYVARAVESVEGTEGLRLQLSPMGTLLESDRLETVLEAVGKMVSAVRALGAERVGAQLKLDCRYDRDASLEDKVESVRRHLASFRGPGGA